MKRIILFKGVSQYGVSRKFTDYIDEGFKRRGIDTDIVDLSCEGWQNDMMTALTKGCDAVFSFGGYGIDLNIEGESFYEKYKIPFIAFFIDHPIYDWDKIEKSPENGIMIFVDRSHIKFVKRFGKKKNTLLFIPHGGACGTYEGERDIEIAFIGSCKRLPEVEKMWKDIPEVLRDVFITCTHKMSLASEKSIEEVVERELEERGIYFKEEILKEILINCQSLDGYIRILKRHLLLKEAAKTGKVKYYGNNDIDIEWFGEEKKNIEMMGNVEFDEALEIMARSKIVLNGMPNFPDGGHERIMSAMANGAVVFTDKSRWLEQNFKDGENIVFYSFAELDKIQEQLKALLGNKSKMEEISQKGKEISALHMWENRVEEIVRIFEIII